MTTTTRLASRAASPNRDWRTSASCRGLDDEELFSDRPSMQARMQKVCHYCPVRVTCLQNALQAESGEYMLWHVVGGLTDTQRRALRVEALLGNRPNLAQAHKLTRPVFAEFMRERETWPADAVAADLRQHDIIAAPVTVRLALWWTGFQAGLQPVGDVRSPAVWVRQDCKELAGRLRELGAAHYDIAAYLGVSRDALDRASKVWRTQDRMGVAA